MHVLPIRTRLFRQGESLVEFIVEELRRPSEGSVIVITSKIVSLAQGRVIRLREAAEKENVIRSEGLVTLRTPWCWLTRKNGEWCANAGVDESNAGGSLILLPRNLQKTARALLRQLQKCFHRKKLGVIITDTRIYPMRVGTMGVALGYAGFAPLKNYVGTSDLFGRTFKHTQANLVNALAVAAVFVMGEGAERHPLAVIEDAEVEFTHRAAPSPRSLTIDPADDLYRMAYEFCRKKRGAHPKRPYR